MAMRHLAFVGLLASCVAAPLSAASADEAGIASIYMYGRHVKTASGALTNDAGLNAAHKSLPFGTMVKVTNKRNGNSVVVKIIDRGPYSGATVDLTARTKQYLRFTSGTVRMARVDRFRVLAR